MTDPREANLPKWAQETLSQLRKRIETFSGRENPFVKELANLRPQVLVLKDRLNAMDEIMQYLIKGGHPDAAKIRELVGGYGMKIVETNPDQE